jgi:hypothetical protein
VDGSASQRSRLSKGIWTLAHWRSFARVLPQTSRLGKVFAG